MKDFSEIVSARLGAQMLSGPAARSPEAVVNRLLAVQAQDARGARLAVRSRTVGLSAAEFTTNGFQFRLTGPVGIYVIQASTNLTDWFPVATNNTPTGLWDYTDPTAAGVGSRFYRALLQ